MEKIMVANTICDDFLKKLGEIQNMSLAGEKETQFANCEQFSSFYGVWITELKELGVEQISMFELSLREYTLSLLFVASGLYKQAMASLRFSLEYTLFSIMLSSSELNYRLWKTHQKDECWAETIHAQTGVYGSVFIQAFAPELKNHGASLQTLARDVYRECSEYVHGNYEVMQETPLQVEYKDQLFDSFIDKADSVAYLITFALTIRFWGNLKGSTLASLETPIMSYLSTIPEIIALYGN